MYKIVKVEPFDDFQLYVEYADGFGGKINVKKMLKHKDYKCINDINEFKKVGIDKKTKDIVWECGATMCKTATRNMLELKEEIKNLGLPINL